MSTRAVQSTLAPMNWRRGLVLAGIHLAMVVPTLVREEARFWQYTNTEVSSRISPHVERVLFQEGQALDLDPCHWHDIGFSRSTEVEGFANLPTALLTGWHDSCLTKTSLGKVVRRFVGRRNHAAEIADCICLALLVFIQWFLIGAFPLVRPKSWWLEPGAFITITACVGVAIALLPSVSSLARIPALLAGLAWLWYFALLLWIPVHHAWQSTLHGLRRLS